MSLEGIETDLTASEQESGHEIAVIRMTPKVISSTF